MRRSDKGPTHSQPAFTIVEVLLVIGIIGVLLSLLLPSLGSMKARTRQLGSLSNIRQIGLMLNVYAQSNRDRPPVFFDPVYISSDGPFQEITFDDGSTIFGAWFANGSYAHMAFDPVPSIDVLRDPAAPTHDRDDWHTAHRMTSDYKLSDSFYADPDYWDRDTQEGVEQWGVQALSNVTFPSDKGMIRQIQVYDVPGFADGYGACCVQDVESVVLWVDMSAQRLVQADLLPGVPNAWHHGIIGGIPPGMNGFPIDDTRHGVFGRDR